MRRHGSTTHWWSPGCDLPHAMLPNRSWKGLYVTINQLLSPRLTSSNLGWVPVKQLPAQHGPARGQVPWLARVASGSTSPCTQKHTNTHNCSKPAGLVSGRPPLQVTIQSPVWPVQVFFWLGASMGNVPFYGPGQLGRTAGQQCPLPARGSQPGRSRAHRLSCLEGQLRLWIALRASSQILQSCLAKPCCDPLASSRGGVSAAHIYTCVYLCVSVYIHLCTDMCVHMYVCVQFGEMH